jgi:hypothetical protein
VLQLRLGCVPVDVADSGWPRWRGSCPAQNNMDSEDMSAECKEEVTKDMNRMAHDYRLNWRLNHACEVRARRQQPQPANQVLQGSGQWAERHCCVWNAAAGGAWLVP